MKEFKNPYLIFSLVWLAVFSFQAWWTPPHIDEVYYWRFSQHLDWGYFDHPPMVALMIFLSDLFFDGTLGIRALTVVTTLASINIIWRTIELREKAVGFWWLIASLPLLHLYGFITTPDVPLLFFGALYFYVYKSITQHHKWKDYVLWGVVMGLMLYSKYHGALLIIITLVSNPRLFLKPKIYVAGAIGLLIWAPHIVWQYEHNWMTFRYHLSERAGDFKWFFPFEYLGNLLVVFNPLFIGLLVKTIRGRWKGEYERTLYFTLVGFILFFALQSFRDHVQPQWLVLIYIPFIYFVTRNSTIKQVRKLALISLPLIIALHVLMTWDLLGTDGAIWRKETFVHKIETKAADRPVVFFDSYQDPSVYEFYRPETSSHSFNRAPKRKNQYNIWLHDTLMNGQEVYVYAPEKYQMPEYMVYRSFDKLEVEMKEDSSLWVVNPYHYDFEISDSDIRVQLILYKDKKVIGSREISTLAYKKIVARTATSLDSKAHIPPETGADAFGYAVRMHPWPAAAVYHRYKIR